MGPRAGAAGQGHQGPRLHLTPSMAQEHPQIWAAEQGTYMLRVIWQESGQCDALSCRSPDTSSCPGCAGQCCSCSWHRERGAWGQNISCSPWGHGTHQVLGWAPQCQSMGPESRSFAHQALSLAQHWGFILVKQQPWQGTARQEQAHPNLPSP